MKFKEIKNLLEMNDWQIERQKGSHVHFIKGNKKVIVPFHGSKDLAKGTLHSILKQRGLNKPLALK